MSTFRKIKPSHYTLRNRVELIKGGSPFFSRLHELISGTRSTLYLQFYIFTEDETGMEVITALQQAARRGVAVYLHIDAYASQALRKRTVLALQEAGVQVKRFEPLLRSTHFYFGRRLHHKVVVADGMYSLVGGINVSNRYNDLPGDPAWLDMALYCAGEASLQLQDMCRELWGNKSSLPATPRADVERFSRQIPPEACCAVRVRRNDWVKRRSEITQTYAQLISRAEKRIIICCSYFLPGRLIRRKLAQAVRRGVTVQVILAGNSDVMIVKHAERYLYSWMLKKNIEIYEYQESVLHAKVSVADNSLVTIGSYNVNKISAYASLEVNLDVSNPGFAGSTTAVLEDILQHHCKQVTAENYQASARFFRKIWQRICYGIINNGLNLFTFYFKQEEK